MNVQITHIDEIEAVPVIMGRPTEAEMLTKRRAREILACDLLLARLFQHHHDHAAAFLKGVEPSVVDLEPPTQPTAEIIPLPVRTAETMPFEPTIAQIVHVVCSFYRISMMDICSARKQWDMVKGRQVTMYLARKHTAKSLPQIGRFLGGKDHTSVLHGCRKISEQLPTNDRLKDEIELIEMRLSKLMLSQSQQQLNEAIAAAAV